GVAGRSARSGVGGWPPPPDAPGRPVLRPPSPGPDRMRQRGLWWAVAAGAVAVAAIVSLGIAYASSGPHHVFHTPVAVGTSTAGSSTAGSSTSAGPSPTRSTSASPNVFACLAPVPEETRCLKAPECYDAAKKPIDCAGRH